MGRLFVTALIGLSCVAALAADVDVLKLPPAATRTIDFARDVRPLFEQTCYGCHGPEKQKSNYRLDSRPHAMKGGHGDGRGHADQGSKDPRHAR
jgi:hypothetical protein